MHVNSISDVDIVNEDYVGVTMVPVRYRYIFLLVCNRYPMTFETTHSGLCLSLYRFVVSIENVSVKGCKF